MRTAIYIRTRGSALFDCRSVVSLKYYSLLISHISMTSSLSLLISEEQEEEKEELVYLMHRDYLVPPSSDDVPEPAGGNRASSLLLLNLPGDALHGIASFLSASDWRAMSCASKASRLACRGVFHRVRMHGFRCATEVIAAWVSDEYL